MSSVVLLKFLRPTQRNIGIRIFELGNLDNPRARVKMNIALTMATQPQVLIKSEMCLVHAIISGIKIQKKIKEALTRLLEITLRRNS